MSEIVVFAIEACTVQGFKDWGFNKAAARSA